MSDFNKSWAGVPEMYQRDTTHQHRKVIQIAVTDGGSVIALCSDATIWRLPGASREWSRMVDVPQGDA